MNMESLNGKFFKILSQINDELSSGLLYTHARINDSTKKRLGSTSFLYVLSKQDVEERIIRWEFGKPYLIAHDTDGYGVHLVNNL